MDTPTVAATVLLVPLIAVPAALFVSLLSLNQFAAFYGLLASFSQRRYKNAIWKTTRPCASPAIPFTVTDDLKSLKTTIQR
jgi:hypothetical protein